ncbi:MAG: hypothetical protein ACI4IX_02760 [Acutalibacteraceae bacterium]
MCNTFIKIISVIILIIAFLVNALGHFIGIGDIIPTGCLTTTEVTTEVESSTAEPTTGIIPTEPTSATEPTSPETTSTTVASTATTTAPATTTTTAPATTATTSPTTTTTRATTKPTTTEEGPFVDSAEPVSFSILGGNRDDIFKGVASTSDGGFVACGISSSTTGDLDGKYSGDWQAPYSFVAKFDKDGNLKWLKGIGSSTGGVVLEDIAVLSSGSIVAVGYSKATEYAPNTVSSGTNNAIALKISTYTGKVTLQKGFGGSQADMFYCVDATENGFVVGGKAHSNDGSFEGLPGSSAIIMNFDSDFNTLWKKYLHGEKGASIEDISVDTSGNIFAACLTSSTTGEFAAFEELMGKNTDSLILKYDSDGNYQWGHVIATSGIDEFASVAADNKGGCLVGGQYELMTTVSPDGTLEGIHNCGGIDAVLVRLNSEGERRWVKVISGISDDFITGVAATTGGFAVTGYTASANRDFSSIGNKGDYDGFTCFVSNSGTTVQMFSQAGSGEDSATAVACSESGRVMVVGKSTSTDSVFTKDESIYGAYTGYVSVYSVTAS